jgi:type I restriction enzyme, S subunit
MMKYEYRNSGINWIGKVPKHWKIGRIKDIVNLKSGENIVSEQISEDEEFPVFGGNGVRGYYSNYTHDGDFVLIGRQGALCGNVNYAHGKFWASEHAVVATPIKNVELIWLGELLRTMNLNQYSNSAAQPGLSVEKIKNIYLPIPPTPEQVAIANYLDKACTDIDRVIQIKRKQIENLQQQLKSIIHHVVTKGLNSKAEMKDSYIEWIGKVPRHWKRKRIKDIVCLQSGDNITSEQIADDGEFPVYGGNGLRGYFSNYTHEGNYVLIGRQGALCGNINYASGKFWASEHAVVATPIKKIVTLWLGEILRTMNLNQCSNSAAQPGLSVEKIKNLYFIVPPFKEQDEIADYIYRYSNKAETVQLKIKKQIETLTAYKKSLIHEVVTGKKQVYGLTKEKQKLQPA